MASNLKYSGLRKMSLEIPAYSMGTFDYFDTPPNYFRLQNRGASTVFCSTGNIPTQKVYDFSVAGTKTKMYAQPNKSNKLFVFNPSGSPVEVVCLSFSAEFDPLTLAFSEIEISMPESVVQSFAIDGFNVSLPNGSNNIGKVGFSESLPAGNKTIGGVEVVGIPASLTSLLTGIRDGQVDKSSLMTKIEQVISALESGSSSGGVGEVDMKVGFANQSASSETVTGFSYDGETLCEINFITNDGDKDVAMVVTANEGTNRIIIKTGETINDFRCFAKAVSFGPATSGESVSFRSLYKYTVR